MHEPVKVMAQQQAFVPITNLEVSLKEAVVGQKYELNLDTISKVEPETATNKTNPKWMIFYPYGMDIEIEGDKKSNVTAFTPKEEGYVWLYVEMQFGAKPTHSPWTTDGNFKQFFKLPIKKEAGGAEPNIYPESAKDKLKPLKAPIQMGWFRTWHDYWVEAPWAESSHKFSDAPAEVDIMAVFPDYTSPDNPFWEKLKREYVPTLNARGTRVIRTVGIRDVDGRRGITKGLFTEDTEEKYREVAQKVVDEYVTKYDLDGLDIDFEYHDTSQASDNSWTPEVQKRAKGVIKEISKIIGPKNPNRTSNLIFVLDTNRNANEQDQVFVETHDCYDYVMRQNYSRGSYVNSYNTYTDYLPKEKYITGFSFYEENGNQWNNVPREDLVAERNSNKTILNSPDELFSKQAFLDCDAFKQTKWVLDGGYGGICSYAIERDGVAHGNNHKFFKLSQGGQPSQYFFSKALKHYMVYRTGQDVTNIEGVPVGFNVGETLTLTGTVKPDEATKKDIEWEVVQGQDKTTAQGAEIKENNKLTATGIGKITVKATVKNSVKTGTPLEYQDFSKEFEITVNKKPVVVPPSGGNGYYVEPSVSTNTTTVTTDAEKEKIEKEKLEKEKLEKEKLEKEKIEKEKFEREKSEKEKNEKEKLEKETSSKISVSVEEVIKTKSKTASVGKDTIRKVLEAESGKIQVKVKSAIVSISKAVIENVLGYEPEKVQVSVTKTKNNESNLKKFEKKLSGKKLVTNTVLSVAIKMGEENINDYELNGNKVRIEVKTSLKNVPKAVYVINLDTGKMIKAKYNKKTKKIYFNTEEVGRFVLVKKDKKGKVKK